MVLLSVQCLLQQKVQELSSQLIGATLLTIKMASKMSINLLLYFHNYQLQTKGEHRVELKLLFKTANSRLIH
jgi:hypothetical protein